GKRKDKTCAAHALPCGIKINGMMPHKLLTLHRFIKLQMFVAEPYGYTNIVPISVNEADYDAEAYRRDDGTGLVSNFVDFRGQVLAADVSSSGKLNRASLRPQFAELIRKSQESFEIALSSKEQVTSSPFFKSDITLSHADEEAHEDNVRSALRAQART